MFDLEGLYIGLASLHPGRAHGLYPAGLYTFHVGALFGDEFVLWSVGIPNDKVGHVGGKIELVDRAHLLSS